MIEDIVDELKGYVIKNVKDRSRIDFELLTGKTQKLKLSDFNYEYDGRLEDADYRDNAFTIVTYLQQTRKIIGKATFFIVDYPLWKEIFFWKQQGEILEKMKMENFFQNTDKKCIIMGYGQIGNSIRLNNDFGNRGKMIEYYYAVLTFLLKRGGSVFYCEPCGYYCLSNQMIRQDELQMSNFDCERLGRVCPESVVSEKIVKHLHFKRLESCYHYLTLGPIYYNE